MQFPAAVTRNARSVLGASAGGVTATLLDISVLWTLVHAGVAVALAAFVGALSGAVACFVINKRVAFADRSPVTFEQVGRFSLVAVATALFMAAAMHVVAVWGGVPVLAAKLVCAAVVFVAWSYPAQKKFVFRPIAPHPGASLA
jgi:putative flippase GtrA